MNGAEAIGLSTLLLTGFLLVRDGDVSVGDVTAAALLFHRLFGPLGTLLLSFDEVQRAAAALARLVGVDDLDVPAGSSLAVVGESGAGKTTLAAIVGGCSRRAPARSR